MRICLHAFLCGLLFCGLTVGHAWADTAPDFQRDILPIFEAKCLSCHGAKRRGGKLDMRSLDSMLKGGVTGPAIKPGNAQKSLLIELIYHKEMPPKKDVPAVTGPELELLRRWIDLMPVGSPRSPSA